MQPPSSVPSNPQREWDGPSVRPLCPLRPPAPALRPLPLLQVAIVTGGDSGIGRAVAVMMAKEKAKAVALVYVPKEQQARRAGPAP